MPARFEPNIAGASEATTEPLNADLTLEIIARRSRRPLRRAILDLGFRRRMELRGAASGGFGPALPPPVAVSYRLREHIHDTAAVLPSSR